MEFGHLRTYSRLSSTRSGDDNEHHDEQALRWAAIERLPTLERARKGILHGVVGGLKEVDLPNLGPQERKDLLEKLVRDSQSNEHFLQRLKDRIDSVSLKLPTIEVRFKNVNVEGEAYVGRRALPTILNSFKNIVESVGSYLHVVPSRKKQFTILHNVSGIIRPGRMTLLLGPPDSGKTTLLQNLSGKLDPELKFSGDITYNGHEMSEFVPQRTSAYISQYDTHLPQLTVRETLTFSAKCQGVGSAYDMLTELLRREKLLNIKPDPYIDALMKASVLKGHHEDLATDYILKILGLEDCADTIVGDAMVRGISGGQKKRVTTGEMLVGPINALFMDNISTGLDSSTTFQIVQSIRQSIHIFGKTALISLLQPPPETFELFDDIILLSEGEIVYQGPRENVFEFFESVGFRCPERKAVADFLQEVTSRKDQKQYWVHEESRYQYVRPSEFAELFKSFHIGRAIEGELMTPFDRSNNHPAALTRSKYGVSKTELLKACLSREVTLMKRNMYFHMFAMINMEVCAIIVATFYQQTRKRHGSIDDGIVHLGALFSGIYVILFSGFSQMPMTIDRLPVFYKQRDLFFYPAWAFSLPTVILAIPFSVIETALWVMTTYYSMGFDPSITRLFKHFFALMLTGQMSYSLFRCMAALSRDHIVSHTAGCLAFVWIMLFGGFVLSRINMKKWLIWGLWTSPLMYAQTAISTNEFLSNSWKVVLNGTKEALGISVLKSRGVFTDPDWYWIGVMGVIGFTLMLNGISTLAFAYLNQYGKSRAVFLPEEELLEEKYSSQTEHDDELQPRNRRKGMLLPFTPVSLTFHNVTYSVDMPKEIRSQSCLDNRLVLLKGVNGAFRPGVLTALMGVSGAGKTTLMDVLAGRKNRGYTEGEITVSGLPKNQENFTRISAYCEQNDIHSPFVTVHESLLFSAWLRLSPEVDPRTRELFVEEIMSLVELNPLRDAMVGCPNLNGLSVEQRKRLTIAIELVANPSIIFMDEPTSGLDARAAATIMRTIRTVVDTGRTVICTIHQPSLDIFGSFDELVLLARGGEEIYAGPLGLQSREMIEYFESINGVRRMPAGYNPATWVLEVTTMTQEELLGLSFSEVYKNSELYRRNEALIKELSTPSRDSEERPVPSRYSQPYLSQFRACLWKQSKSYWRNTSYNGARLAFNAGLALMLGMVFWGLGSRRQSRRDIFNGIGAMNTAITFMGTQSATSITPVLITERIVYYREKAAGMYSALPYSLAQVVIEIPCTLIQVLIYEIIVYAMIGYEWTAIKFFLNLFFMFFTILYFIYYGMMVTAVSPNQETAAILSGVIYTMWSLFSGFMIPRKRIAVWWRWFPLVSPVSWSLYGMAALQYGDVDTKLDSGEAVSDYMREYFGFRYDFLWEVSLILIGFAIFFAAVYTYSLKVLNFQKR